MKQQIIEFIKQNNLSPFNSSKTYLKTNDSIYKTRDSKTIHNKVISKISQNFIFPETSNIFNFFEFTSNPEQIKQRQDFFNQIPKSTDKQFLKQIKKPKKYWNPKYDIIVVTEDEDTFLEINKMNCASQLLLSQTDLQNLDRYDIIQVINCDNFSNVLDRLPQTVSIDSIENIYLERYLEQLSAWHENLNILNQNPELNHLTSHFQPLLNLLENKKLKIITKEEAEQTLEDINEKINQKIKEMTISGESLLKIVREGKLPQELDDIIKNSINQSGIPEYIFEIGIPLKIDEKELDDLIKKQSSTEFSDLAETIKSNAEKLKSIPKHLEKLEAEVLFLDFITGIAKFMQNHSEFPQPSQEFIIQNSKNYFLDNPQPISFKLNQEKQCSILTGANSGGKTTLLEHVIQSISLFQLGLPVSGNIQIPIFTDIYYFAKNKGSASKGAFETLLTQMSKIKPGQKTLILADEIEAVTEPGVAGKIISATADYFLKQNCFLIIATHLGYEIQHQLPEKARIDGIEASGLDENFELIVNHNPILGRLAHSTPELIVEKMANSKQEAYFKYLNQFLKK